MANITTTTAAEFLPTLWAADVLMAAEDALVAAPLVRRYDSQVKAKGQALKIPTVSNITATAKTINTDITPTAPTDTAITLNVDKWYYAAVEIEDMAAVQAAYDLRSVYAEKLGYGIAEQVDTDVLALYTGLTNTDVGQYGIDVDDETMVAARLALDLANAPVQNRAYIVSPYQTASLMKIDKYVMADSIGSMGSPSPVVRGPNSRYLWGEIYGTPVYYTNNIPVTAATPTQTHNMLIHRDAFALAMQMAPRLQAQYWTLALAWIVVVDAIYGVTTTRPTFGVEIRS